MIAKGREVSHFLRERRRQLGHTQPTLGVASGLSEQAIRKYEKDGFPADRPQSDKLWRLLDVLRIRRSALPRMLQGLKPLPDELLPLNGSGHGRNAIDFVRSLSDSPANVELTTIPMDDQTPCFHQLPANRLGGPGDFYAHDSVQPDEFVRAPKISASSFVVKLAGDCMEPRYKNGDYVVVDYDVVERSGRMIPGAAYYIQLRGEGDGRATFKRFVRQDGEVFVFDCINKKYPDEIRIDPPFNAAKAEIILDIVDRER